MQGLTYTVLFRFLSHFIIHMSVFKGGFKRSLMNVTQNDCVALIDGMSLTNTVNYGFQKDSKSVIPTLHQVGGA